MIYDDTLRQILLAATLGIFVIFSVWGGLRPESLASVLGYKLESANSFSEFHAIYVGVFLAQALLCALALVRIHDAVLGNLVAIFLLSQPLGRFIAAIRHGFPSGILKILFVMEVAGGVLLLAIQPSAG
ncbi:DUF4345 family protein [Endozoicomonas elysicola]|uniref:DUF4345 family protein n=1 Tax=Endozoicomonas elysicola TaxID=305900 RepID=UPI0003A5CE68|nr:DUF4345 family protein [Endozoicomonas elysicola]